MRARKSLIHCAIVAFCGAGSAFAQTAPVAPAPAPVEIRFDIERIAVEGNTLLPQSQVDGIAARYTGKQRDFGDIQRALEALELAYRERGYSAVQVFLPEQELDKGTVKLRVIESRIRKLQVQGNKFFDEANIRASLPSLREGATPNANEVSRNLRIVNETPAKQTAVTLKAGEKEGEIDAVVEVTDEKPQKWFATLDNTGTKQSGYHRIGIGYQHSNLFGRDHAVTFQYVTSLEKPKVVSVYSVGYHMPLYEQGASADFILGYSDSDVGATQTPTGELKFSGRGTVMGARLNQQFHRLGTYDHRVTFAIDHRIYENTCTLGVFGAAGCGSAAASFKLTPVWATYAGTLNRERGMTGVYLTAGSNLGTGPKGDTSALGRARFGARAGYWVLRGGVNVIEVFEGDWQLRGRLEGQYANEVLVSAEQFGVGGMNSVRGFLERERADDRGYSGSIELHGPDLAVQSKIEGWNARPLVFVDLGRTFRVNPLPGEVSRNSLASWGGGFRLSQEKAFSLRFDLAQILDQGGTRQKHHWRGSFSSVLSF